MEGRRKLQGLPARADGMWEALRQVNDIFENILYVY